ncbi:restriction endonuclease [Nocardiopsis sp. NPDC058631]|uniref:restriction endonuclease n=1 Tax=Nocardiopsis sp. NPDC058631 TaxID=3346566 RepID=UPI00364A7405
MPQPQDKIIPFDALTGQDLVLDAVYAGGSKGTSGDDPIGKLLPVGNSGGFRYRGSPAKQDIRLCALCSSGKDPDWPDELDPQTGLFTYYGDNKEPGSELHDTPRRGNVLLRDTFAWANGSAEERSRVFPFMLLQSTGRGRDVRFRGLAAPGAAGLPADEELVAIWRSTQGQRFQNYRAVFTILDVPVVTRAWIDEILEGCSTGPNSPEPWRRWVAGRQYTPLQAPSTTTIRTKEQQEPGKGKAALVAEIVSHFKDNSHAFEGCAVELWRMMAPSTGRAEVTRHSRDGGRDAVGEYELGPMADRVAVEFALEAKCYSPSNGVGVRDTSRLISRLRHRQFGVFVTTSYFNRQAYKEVREDKHPVVLICGKDIADLLASRGYSTPEAVREWLAATFPHDR